MADTFEFSATDEKRLMKFYRTAPRKFGYATADVLNQMAFGNRNESINILHNRLTIRNKNFVNSSMRVEKAKGYHNINTMESKFGSIKKDRSSGWIEQETGRRSNKDRVATIMGRSGSESKQIKPSIRLKQGRRFKSAQDFEPNGSVGRTLMMLMKLKREKYKKPFVVRRRNKYKRRGMYKFVRGKAKLLYAFNTKKVRPARVVWLRGGSRVDNNKNNIRDRWGVAIEKQLQPRIGK